MSQVYRRKHVLEKKLYELQAKTPLSSPIAEANFNFTISEEESNTTLRRRRAAQSTNYDLTRERSNVADAAETISKEEVLSEDRAIDLYSIIVTELNVLDGQLAGRLPKDSPNHYPANLTLSNFVEWTLFPTLVYELDYPRQEQINWLYILEKSVAFFGGIFIMLVVSQAYLYPPIMATVRMHEQGVPFAERLAEFPWIALDILFPLLLEQLLSWYVIWECLLNVLAEVTRFADRGFYGDWWNCVSWDQWARDWNRPVHNFLLRHVYHSSISAFQLSKKTATVVTFFLSACVHELLMFCLFRKLRGYLFVLQLAQVPLIALSRTKLLKGHSTLGNSIFWFGLYVGKFVLSSFARRTGKQAGETNVDMVRRSDSRHHPLPRPLDDINHF